MPPPLLDDKDFFEFQNYLKDADPSLRSNSEPFEFENILTAEDPLGQTSQNGYLLIFTLKRANQVFSLLGWGLRVIYNSDISLIEIRTFFQTPLLGTLYQINKGFNYDATPEDNIYSLC